MSDFIIASVGDIFFGESYTSHLPISPFLNKLKLHSKNDFILIGNLEGPLISDGNAQQGKCTLKSNPLTAKLLYEAGFQVLSIANNHIMDFGQDGLFNTIELLKSTGIKYAGAGENEDDARRPCLIEVNGYKIAFLARSSVIVSSPCYVTATTPGVAFLDSNEIKADIRECKKEADIVVLMLHWGIEHYSYPSPDQRLLAKELISAGADIIIGHHPHVLQGIERMNNGLICYSLGNFIFRDIEWSYINEDGQRTERTLVLSEMNRQGGFLKLGIADKCHTKYEFIPSYIDDDGIVKMDDTPERIRQFDVLCSKLKKPYYKYFWLFYSARREWTLRLMPLVKGKMTWNKIKKVRFKHFVQLIKTVHRSAKITSTRSTNPYE